MLFWLLKRFLPKVKTDFFVLMPKDKEQTKETKGEQTASNKGKNSCSADIKGIKSKTFWYYLFLLLD